MLGTKNRLIIRIWITLCIALSALTIESLGVSAEEHITRIQGINRFETAAQISKETYDSSNTVLIANAREFADALAGVPLAYELNAPILIAQGSTLHPAVIKEINRLNAKDVIILGGEQAVSVSIQNELKSLGLETRRLSGEDRFETAEKIAAELYSTNPSRRAVLVDGFEFADAMSVAPFAAREGMPIFLTRTNKLSSEIELKKYETIYIIGGESAVSKTIEAQLPKSTLRIEGQNRYQTNSQVLSHFTYDSEKVFIATGQDFADALTGSVLAAKENSGVALIRKDLSNEIKRYSVNDTITKFTILGGEQAVSNNVIVDLRAFLNGEGIDFPHPNENSYNYQLFEDTILEKTNELRRSKGVQPLKKNNELTKGATIRSFESHQQFAHYRPDGSYFLHVFADYNIPYKFTYIGENLAMGSTRSNEIETAEQIFLMWQRSQGHYENMIHPDFDEIGIGYYNTGRYVYGTQILGTRK